MSTNSTTDIANDNSTDDTSNVNEETIVSDLVEKQCGGI